VTVDNASVLLASPRFQDFAADDVTDLAAALQPRSIADGDTLFEEGDPAPEAYIVASGRLALTRKNREGRPQNVLQLGPGEVLGLMALVENRGRSTTATAVGDVEVLVLPRAAFTMLYESKAPISLRFQRLIGRLLAEDVREVTNRVVAKMLETPA
jgi:CRP/FNR family cyclic AMP-dependent transcriptional regulator